MKKNQSKLRNTITEMKKKKKQQKELTTELGNTEKYASDVEDGKMETAQTELSKKNSEK